ncbi:MAG: sialidase family protein [Actinomycetota bacterium]
MTRQRFALLVSLVLLSSFAASTVGEAALAKKKKRPKPTGPAVIQDAEAGRHVLKATPPQQQDTTTEPSISVNPEDPLNAVAVYQSGRVDGGCGQSNGYATMFDGGKTWEYGAFPGVTTSTGGASPLASDPVVAFGPDNVVYMNHLLCDAEGNNLGFSVSTDGGKTWGDLIRVPDERTFPLDDKNWIVVDNGAGAGHHTGRIYMVWDQVAPVVAMYSDDQAQTWQGPFLIYAGQGIGTIPMVTPDGDLAVVYNTLAYPVPRIPEGPGVPEVDPEGTKFVLSLAAGAGTIPTGGPLVFAPPVTVARYLGTDMRFHRASEDLPTADIDPNSGRIYVAWGDNRFRSDVVNDIVVTHSDDEGLTWSDVERINPGATDDYLEHITPAIAVGQDGIVRISYRTQQQGETFRGFSTKKGEFSPYVDTWYQESKDSGETWSEPLLVNTDVRTDVRFATFSRSSAFLGDYSQVAVAGSWAYIVRCEAYPLSKKELKKATFPPIVYHTRTWVAVVDTDGNGKA